MVFSGVQSTNKNSYNLSINNKQKNLKFALLINYIHNPFNLSHLNKYIQKLLTIKSRLIFKYHQTCMLSKECDRYLLPLVIPSLSQYGEVNLRALVT